MGETIIIVCLVVYLFKVLLPIGAFTYLAHRAYGAPQDKNKERFYKALKNWDLAAIHKESFEEEDDKKDD
jgi:hypothetical protein